MNAGLGRLELAPQLGDFTRLLACLVPEGEIDPGWYIRLGSPAGIAALKVAALLVLVSASSDPMADAGKLNPRIGPTILYVLPKAAKTLGLPRAARALGLVE